MYKIVQFESSRGSIYVETMQRIGDNLRGDVKNKAVAIAAKTFEDSLEKIKDIAVVVVEKIESLSKVPAEVEVAFSLGFDLELGAVIAKTSLEGQLSVKLTWKKD